MSNDTEHKNSMLTKMRVFYLLALFLGGGVMLASTFKTQVVDGDMWREKAKHREVTERIVPARRGTIYSSDGKVLATTIPVCDLCLDLGRWPKTDSHGKVVTKNGSVVMESCIDSVKLFKANLDKVCQILHEQPGGKSVEYYRSRILTEYVKAKPSRCLYVERRVPYSQWAAIKNMPGWSKCVVTKTSEGDVMSYVRAHIYGNLGENTIGLHYKTANQQGYTGLEGYYDSVLRGQDGMYRCRRLTRGIWLPMEEGDNVLDEDSVLIRRRVDGQSIVATIDTRYQDIAHDALSRSMNQWGGQRGCAILMEVSTGYVLACCNLTRDTQGHLAEHLWSNVACSDHYEPGSTFKTVAMTAMLNDASIGLDTSKRVQCGGQKQFSATSGIINDGHGNNNDTSNLAGVLAHSSNVGMSELAWQYYRKRRQDFKKNIANIFPYGMMRPDISVPETPTTIVKSLKPDRDFLNLSYGYSSTVTPLQLITFYNGIANGGKMLKPLFCREILNNGRVTKLEPVVLNEAICSPEIAKQMCEMLIGVVEHGTGSNIKGTTYGIGGKTGTAERHEDRSIKNSSFVGFFPADNPRYTCLVLVESTSIAGREVAAPVFKRIADCVVTFDKELGSVHLQDSGRVVRPITPKAPRAQVERIHQLLGIPFITADSVNTTPWVCYDSDREGYADYLTPKDQVPNLKGMTIRDAMQLCHNVGMKVRFTGQGKVVSQTPKARTKATKGGTITLVLKP